MADDKVTIQITGESAELQAALKKASDALTQLQTKVGQTSGDLTKMDAATRSLTERWDPAAKALRQGQEAVDGVNQALQAGTITGAQATRVLDGVAASATKAGAAHSEMHGSVATATREFRALFDELSSGRTRQTPGTLAILANRVFGLQGAGLAAAGGIAALALAIGEVLIKAERTNQALIGMDAAMTASGRGADYSEGRMRGLIASLREMPDVSTAAATEMASQLARATQIGVGEYQRLGVAAAGYARVIGEDTPKAMADLIKGLEGGTAGIVKLEEAHHFLSPAQLQTIHDLEEAGRKGEALKIAVDGAAGAFGPLASSVTPAQAAMHELGVDIDRVSEAVAGGITRIVAFRREFPALSAEVASTIPGLSQLDAALRGLHEIGQMIGDGAPPAANKPGAGGGAPGAPGAPSGDANPDAAFTKSLEAARQVGGAARQMRDIDEQIAEIDKGIALAEAGKVAPMQKSLDLMKQARKELEDRKAMERDSGGRAQLQSWTGQLTDTLVTKDLHGPAAQAEELKFWQDKKAQAEAGGAEFQAALKQINQKIYEIRGQQVHSDASGARQAGSEEIAATREKIGEIMAAEGQGHLAQLASARDAWAQLLTSQKLSAQQRLEVEKEYHASIAALKRLGDAEKGQLARGLAANQREINAANLAADREAVEASFQAHQISAAQKAAVETSYARIGAGLQVEILNDELAALKEAGQAETAEYQITADKIRIILAQLDLDLAKIDKQRTADEKAELAQRTSAWKEAAGGILSGEDALASALVNKNESVGKAMKKMFADMATHELGSDLKSGTASIFDSLLGTDLSKGNQGGILVSLFKGLGGAGGAAGAAKSTLGLAGDAGKDAATAANTAALTALTAALTGHGAVMATNTVATGTNSGAALAGAGASAANTGVTATNTATQSEGILVWLENTVATLWNTVATEAGALGGLVGLDVGATSIPFDMPAMVHKGEMIVPARLSAEVRAGRAAIGGAGGGTWGAPRIGMPSIGGVSGGGGATHFHIDASHTLNGGINAGGGDVRSMAREIANNHLDTIIGGLQKAHRNGRLMPGINRR